MLGHGAHGIVWQEKCVLGKDVKVRAVKMIRKFKPQKPWESMDYSRELETVAKLSHPMVSQPIIAQMFLIPIRTQYEAYFVKSSGWFENQEAVYIAMEFLVHGDLQSHLNNISRLAQTEARDITFQILEGLHYMHKNCFAHRDLKPAVRPTHHLELAGS